MDHTRRSLIQAPMAIAFALAVQGAGPAAALIGPAAGRNLAVLEVGRHYLAAHPHEARLDFLLGDLFEAGAAPPPPERFPEILGARAHRDFAAGDSLPVAGWLMARSEARFCAAVLLMQQS